MAYVFANFGDDGRQFDDLMSKRPGVGSGQGGLAMVAGLGKTSDRWLGELFAWHTRALGRLMSRLTARLSSRGFLAGAGFGRIGRIGRRRQRRIARMPTDAFPQSLQFPFL